MKNVLALLKRDFIRLVKAPAALVVVVALLLLPSLYTWYNVLGFWDPYNNTGNMRVAVVNLDKGGTHELTGKLDVGSLIVDALHENDQLSWQFEDYDTAMADLEAGRDYAVFVIPENFTENLLTLFTGDFTQPNIHYYVNMKTGPVSPKITDAGSTTLEETINSTFVETVSDVVVETISSTVVSSNDAIHAGSSQASSQVGEVISSINQARDQLSSVQDMLTSAKTKRSDALSALAEARQALDATADDLENVSNKAGAAQSVLIEITPKTSQAFNKALTALYALKDVADAAGYGDKIDKAINALELSSQAFFSTMIPAVTQGLGNVSTATSQLSSTASNQLQLINQAQIVLDSLDSTLTTAQDALTQTDDLLATLQCDLSTLQTDLESLATSNALTQLVENGTLNSDAIADFMGSPTTVVTEKLYELEVYGFAMAPLFMNLTFWIGAFMLLVIMRQEVDCEGVTNVTVTQRYVSRFIMFALFAVIQAVVCCVGLVALGVHAYNTAAMFFASAMASLAYLSIIYALSVVFQHVGKGLCIILVFMQIPSATGLYPIEMMADFYQELSPFFPFTYGISALREAICGFYGATFAYDIAILGVFFVVFLAFGICLRPVLAGVNRTFAKQIGESGIYNGENADIPARDFHLSWIASALSDKEHYRAKMLERYEHFKTLYPRLIKGAIVFGVVVPVVLGIVLGMTVDEKVTLLSVWLFCLVVVLVFLTVVENLREGFERQLSLSGMNTEEIHTVYECRMHNSAPTPASPNAAASAAATPVAAEPVAAEPGVAPSEHATPTAVGADTVTPVTASEGGERHA